MDGGANRFGYSGGNSLTRSDAYGLWSPAAHDKLFEYAFSGRMSASDVDILKSSSRQFDKDTQSGDLSYMHSMARKNQSPNDAAKQRDAFVADILTQARRAADANNRSEALRLLGQACHPVMDKSSPMHTDSTGVPKTWEPTNPWGHSPNEYIGKETASDLTPSILDAQKRSLNMLYDFVFRGGR